MTHWLALLILITVFLTLGFVFLMIGFTRKRQRQDWEQTTGEIVSRNSNVPGVLVVFPSFEFITNDGEKYQVKSNIKQTPGLAIGRKVRVFYDPSDPRRAQIDTMTQSGMIFTIIGSFMIGVAALIGLIVFFVWSVFFT